MNYLLVYLLESSICLGVFYLFYALLLRNQPSHQYNRFYLLATSLLAFVLPLLEIPIMSTEGIGQVAGNYQNYILLDPAVMSPKSEVASGHGWWNWSYVLFTLYGVGLLVSLAILLRQVFQLLSVVRQSRVVSKDAYQLVYTEGKMPSSSFFSYLFWDNTQQLTEKEAGQIIAHEEAHIREGHSYDVLFMALLKVVCWFHPLVYLYERALTDVHEFTADAQAIKQQNPGSYTQLLTRSLFAGFQPSLVNHFYKSRTLKRIKMMHLTQKQTPRYKYFLALPLLAAVFFTFSCQTEEELEKEAIAATYDDVQGQINSISQKINVYRTKYFNNTESYQEALATVRAQYFTENRTPTTRFEVELAAYKDVASEGDYKTIESYYERLNSLQNKLSSLPDAEGVFMVVDDMPVPEGGMKEFYSYIAQNLKFPQEARQAGMEGKVFIQFVVNEYGELTDFKLLRGMGHGCDEEAIRVLKGAEAWNPGTTDGKPVKVRMVLPITFKLDGTAYKKPTPEFLNQPIEPDPNPGNIYALKEVVAVGYTN